MRESELLGHIYERSRDLAAAFGDVIVGPGDDCAVVRTTSGDLLLITTDQLIEGRHYEAGTPIDLIARKAVARSLSDIAAMGGTPSWGLATAALPEGYEHADELFDAMAKWGRHWKCPLVGGDVAVTSGPMVLSVTVIGKPHVNREELPGCPPVLRSGAEIGDLVYVTGPIGASFESGHHLSFEPRLAEGRLNCDHLATDLHAMIDVSDGLGRDAARIARASGVVVEIDADRVSLRPPATGWNQAFGDGEDYELLFAVSGDAEQTPHTGELIGRCIAPSDAEPPACVVIDPYGKRHRADEMGWDHAG